MSLLIYVFVYFFVGGFVTEEDKEKVLVRSERFINDIYTESTTTIYSEFFSEIPNKQSHNLVVKLISEMREYNLIRVYIDTVELKDIDKGKQRGSSEGEKYSFDTYYVTIQTLVEKDGHTKIIEWDFIWAHMGDRLMLVEMPELEEITND